LSAPCASSKSVSYNCGELVEMSRKTLGKVAELCALSLTKAALIFNHSALQTFCPQLVRKNKLVILRNFYSMPHLNFFNLYSLSTGPINTTNLIKE
jgi:hypothetical protein